MESRIDQLAKDRKLQERLKSLGLIKPDNEKLIEAFELRLALTELTRRETAVMNALRPFGDFQTTPNMAKAVIGDRSAASIHCTRAFLHTALKKLGIRKDNFPFFHLSHCYSMRIVGGQILATPAEIVLVSLIPSVASKKSISYRRIISELYPQLDPNDPYLKKMMMLHMSRLRQKLADPNMLIRKFDQNRSVFFSLAV